MAKEQSRKTDRAKTDKVKTAGAKTAGVKAGRKKAVKAIPIIPMAPSEASVLDRLHGVVQSRVGADPAVSHSARLLSRGPAKVAQKFGEEAVECLIEALSGNAEALIAESADVLYHLIVVWVACGVTPHEVWAELTRREGISGIAEKAARPKPLLAALKPGTSKIP